VRQVAAYAGLIPQQHQSGQTHRLGKITKRGSRLLRTALVEVAWAMLRYNEWAAATYARICGGQKTRKKTAIVAVARKLLSR
jgi:transposase